MFSAPSSSCSCLNLIHFEVEEHVSPKCPPVTPLIALHRPSSSGFYPWYSSIHCEVNKQMFNCINFNSFKPNSIIFPFDILLFARLFIALQWTYTSNMSPPHPRVCVAVTHLSSDDFSFSLLSCSIRSLTACRVCFFSSSHFNSLKKRQKS